MSELARVRLADLTDCAATRVLGGPDGICVIRAGGALYAVADRCSHADVRLSEGEVDCEELTVECKKHGSAFRLSDGEPLSLPATRPVAVYEVVVDGDDVVVIDK